MRGDGEPEFTSDATCPPAMVAITSVSEAEKV